MYSTLKKILLKKIRLSVAALPQFEYFSKKSSTNSLVFGKTLNLQNRIIYLIVEYDNSGYGRLSFYLGCGKKDFKHSMAMIVSHDPEGKYGRFEKNYFFYISEFCKGDACIALNQDTNTSTTRMIKLLLDNPEHSPMLKRLGVDMEKKHHMVGLGLADVLGAPPTLEELNVKVDKSMVEIDSFVRNELLRAVTEYERLVINMS